MVVEDHEIVNLRAAPGQLSFDAVVGGRTQPVWFRTSSPVTPTADAALAASLMPAMRDGGRLTMGDPVSPRMLRTQREFQAIQRAWSLAWEFGDPPLREVEVLAPVREPEPAAARGRVAAFFSGGVDSWATVLDNPDLTDLIFVRGIDLLPRLAHQQGLADRVEERLREAAGALGKPLHVVETNLRELSDPLVRWEAYYGCAIDAVALFLAPLFERVLIAGDSDFEVQFPLGANWMVDQLWSTEQLEIVDSGGAYSRMQRLEQIASHATVRQTLRVCWENPEGAYNCGRCRKCLMTMCGLEALGVRGDFATFPAELDLEAVAAIAIPQPILLSLWEDLLDSARAARRSALERAVATAVSRAKRLLGLPPSYRRRKGAGPPPTIRAAVVVPAWRQARYLAGAVQSALAQEIETGVGVVIVNDGCPDPETDRIGRTLRDAHPQRVAYLRQPNGGVSAARNAGIRHALARWPEVEAFFPLDADNLLSPQTLAKLWAQLEQHPEAAWASPTLEFFGLEEGEWQVPGPFLPYRQLFMNQCDTGSLVRRSLFDAGNEFDETIRFGFEDWEFFLRAALAGFQGVLAGRCGFRYRRRGDSMLAGAHERAQRIEGEIRQRHPAAYEPAALTRREHAEAPRFALVRCDRDDVLLTASLDLEPRRLSVPDYARTIAAAGEAHPPLPGHVPAVTLLTTAAALEQLGPEALAEALFRVQGELRGRGTVGLRVGAGADDELSGLAVRASALARLERGHLHHPEATVEVECESSVGEVTLAPLAWRAAALIRAASLGEGMPLPALAHSSFLEYRHIEEGRTSFPWSGSRQQQTPEAQPA
jgi:Glycosyl transferase family 2